MEDINTVVVVVFRSFLQTRFTCLFLFDANSKSTGPVEKEGKWRRVEGHREEALANLAHITGKRCSNQECHNPGRTGIWNGKSLGPNRVQVAPSSWRMRADSAL